MSSPPTQPIPYLAYKSKRHSRNLSYTLNSPPTNSRPASVASSSDLLSPGLVPAVDVRPTSPLDLASEAPEPESVVVQAASPTSPAPSTSSLPLDAVSTPEPVAINVQAPVVPKSPMRKTSTFRHMPLRAAPNRSPLASPSSRSPLPSSPLRPAGSHSRTTSISSTSSLAPPRVEDPIRQLGMTESSLQRPNPPPPNGRVTSYTSIISDKALPDIAPPTISRTSTTAATPVPSNLLVPPSLPRSTTALSTRSNASTGSRVSAPYRPGFQPKGVYRPRTDEFAAARRSTRDDERVERTKLERRLEKLITLHFPAGALEKDSADNPAPPKTMRRASSFFDVDLTKIDAGGLWKGIMQGSGKEMDNRTQEQRITPWEEDSTASKCPLCAASFHPLTNRKHHCRLCGKIVCSLPVRNPQRPVTCSLLFVVDSKTRRIEEVGEAIDYGVRKKGSVDLGKGVVPEEDKFLKGVRVCRTCRPVLLRQQYQHEGYHVPTFARLYEVFIKLEAEIEESLPQFQEMILSLSNADHPTKEAAAARKRLLEAFAQYDALSKRIRQLPCPKGPGSSQDRVQLAILTRANIFLQKNMFPLQSLPTAPKKKLSTSKADEGPPPIDPDSGLAHALQPLLEQEALLEAYVQEAITTRKFEDAKTLRANLEEIRGEIERVVIAAEGESFEQQQQGNGNGKPKGKRRA